MVNRPCTLLMVAMIVLLFFAYHPQATDGFAPPMSRSVSANKFDRGFHENKYKYHEQKNHPRIVGLQLEALPSKSITHAVSTAVGKLLCTCGIGFSAGRAGLLDQNAISVLSKLIFTLFQPCLLFVNVMTTVATVGKEGGVALYILPLMAMFQIAVGYGLGYLLSRLLYRNDIGSESAKQLRACITFANSGPLPLVFADGLLRNHANPALAPKSVAYISLYLLGWSPLFWIIAPSILNPSKRVKVTDEESIVQQRKILLKRMFSPPVAASMLGMLIGFTPWLSKKFLSTNGPFNPLLEAMRTIGAAYLPSVLLVLAGSLSSGFSSGTGATRLYSVINRNEGVVTDMGTVGMAKISTAHSSVAGYEFSDQTPRRKTDDKMRYILQLATIYLARFVLMPSLGFGLFKAASIYIPGAAELFRREPLLLLVLLLQTCMPSAQNTTVILQLQGKKSAAGRLARLLMAIYVCGIPAMSFWLVHILSLTGIVS